MQNDDLKAIYAELKLLQGLVIHSIGYSYGIEEMLCKLLSDQKGVDIEIIREFIKPQRNAHADSLLSIIQNFPFKNQNSQDPSLTDFQAILKALSSKLGPKDN